MTEPTVVTVRIAGEEYSIRAQATPEYARECASYVDHTIAEIMKGALVHSHKAAILAALAITDQLLQGRQEVENLRAQFAQRAEKLASEVEARLEP